MSLKWLSYIVITYMLMALVWWTILLHSKNEQAYKAKIELYQLENKPELASEKQKLTKDYNRQASMILGEGLVFGLSLLLGIWLIQRSFVRELEVRERQNNFLLSVTHELKSPLTSINLSLDTMRSRKLSTAMVQDISETALTESHRLENLINDLLLTTKLDQKYTFSTELVDVSMLINHTINNFYITRPDISIHSKLTENLLANIEIQAFEKVITNLIENAIKYGNKSDIYIETSKDLTNKKVLVKVMDHGLGVPHKEQGKIFEKFYRVGSENTRKTKGTGLGLYIVDQIIKGLGGTVEYKDNKPTGAILEIKLPLQA